VENSPMLTSRGLGTVLGNLAEMGYNARWCVLGADDAGAPHRRKRIWILAYSSGSTDSTNSRAQRKEESLQGECGKEGCARGANRTGANSEVLAYTNKKGLQGQLQHGSGSGESRRFTSASTSIQRTQITWWDTDPADLPDAGQEYGLQRDSTGMEADQGIRATGTIHNQSGNTGQGEIRPIKSTLGGMVDELALRMDFIESAFGGTVPRVATGIDNRVDRLKAIGNGQVPAVAALAWTILTEDL